MRHNFDLHARHAQVMFNYYESYIIKKLSLFYFTGMLESNKPASKEKYVSYDYWFCKFDFSILFK